MKIATYNVNSIRRRLQILLAWIAEHKPDVMCLQETKVQDEDFPVDAIREAGYLPFFRGEVPHVKQAMGVINHSIDFPLIITGLNQDEFNFMSGGFTYLEGHGLRDPDDVLVDKLYAKQKKLQLGSTVRLLNHEWHLVGIIDVGKLARVVVSLKSLQQVLDTPGKVTAIYLKLDDPANIGEAVRFIEEKTSLKVQPMEEYTAVTYNVNNYPGLSEFIYVVMGIGVVIGFNDAQARRIFAGQLSA